MRVALSFPSKLHLSLSFFFPVSSSFLSSKGHAGFSKAARRYALGIRYIRNGRLHKRVPCCACVSATAGLTSSKRVTPDFYCRPRTRNDGGGGMTEMKTPRNRQEFDVRRRCDPFIRVQIATHVGKTVTGILCELSARSALNDLSTYVDKTIVTQLFIPVIRNNLLRDYAYKVRAEIVRSSEKRCGSTFLLLFSLYSAIRENHRLS